MDIEASETLLDNLLHRAANGTLVVVSSHDLDSLEQRCDLVLILADGKVVAFEPLADLLKRTGDIDVLELLYAGDATFDMLRALKAEPRVLRVLSSNPLRLMVNRGISISDVLALLKSDLQLNEARRNAMGLREAYLAITGNDREEAAERNLKGAG